MAMVALYHGWGFDASVWDRVVALLPPNLAIWRGERGYFGAPVADRPRPRPGGRLVAVAHSLGVAHALDGSGAASALLVLNGFTRLCAAQDWPLGVPARVIERMRARLDVAPGEVVAAFRQRHGAAAPACPDIAAADAGRLGADLRLLRELDARASLAAFGGEMVALGGTEDGLVSPALSLACFGPRLKLLPGGHLLPLTAPDACADAIARLAAMA